MYNAAELFQKNELKLSSGQFRYRIGLYFILFLIYGSVGYFSFGYDDEFFNINLIEQYGFHAINVTQACDVHPPGSYFIDWALFSVLGSWEFVRLAISVISVAALVYAIESVWAKYGNMSSIKAYVLLGLNPAILLWCTGIRWYAFFVPILIWLSIVPSRRLLSYWGKYFIGLLCLGYLGYAMFIVAAPLFLLYWISDDEKIVVKLKEVLLWGIVFLVLYAPQFYIFLTVHAGQSAGQTGSLLKSIFGFYISSISNQGVFPISAPGIIAATGMIGVVFILLKSIDWGLSNTYLKSFSLANIFLIVSGLGSKFRNFVAISPLQALWISTTPVKKHKGMFLGFFALLTIGNLWGVYNVAAHNNTTKNSWDMPVKQVAAWLDAEKIDRGETLVLCHDTALTWALSRSGYAVLGPYSNGLNFSDLRKNPSFKNVILIKTFIGSVSLSQYKEMLHSVSTIQCEAKERYRLSRDNYYYFKNKINPMYPKYRVEITRYINVTSLGELDSWGLR